MRRLVDTDGPEADAVMREMWHAGHTDGEIAARLGLSRNGARHRLKRAGLIRTERRPRAKTTPWTDERREQVFGLWRAGKSATEIAAEVGGTTRNAILGLIHRAGMSGRVDSNGQKITTNPNRRRERRTAPRTRTPREQRCEKPKWDRAAIPPTLQEDLQRTTLVTLSEVESHHCRYVVGDVAGGETLMCGADKVPGLSYCERHAARVFEAPKSRTRKPSHAFKMKSLEGAR